MTYCRTVVALLGATFVLGACSGVMPSASSPTAPVMPALGTSAFAVDPIRPGAPTGTFVGQKIQQMRGDLAQLQQSIRQHSDQLQGIRTRAVQDAQTYYGITASINARLQVGTTPGNPVLLQTWNQAQAQLNQMDGNISQMNDLGNRLATDSALAGYLNDAINAAYQIPGAVDEDHRQLATLQGEVQQTSVVVSRVAAEVGADIARQRSYIASERQSLNVLAQSITAGQLYGGSFRDGFAGRSGSFTSYSAPQPAHPRDVYTPVASAPEPRRPLVIIRFDRPDVEYEQPLYTALSQALERRPDATFDVVSVTPVGRSSAASAAKWNSERVMRSLAEMGLPAARIRLSAANSPDADVGEVHIYVR
jgi:hypothetical protein